jgi:hypothetical protein
MLKNFSQQMKHVLYGVGTVAGLLAFPDVVNARLKDIDKIINSKVEDNQIAESDMIIVRKSIENMHADLSAKLEGVKSTLKKGTDLLESVVEPELTTAELSSSAKLSLERASAKATNKTITSLADMEKSIKETEELVATGVEQAKKSLDHAVSKFRTSLEKGNNTQEAVSTLEKDTRDFSNNISEVQSSLEKGVSKLMELINQKGSGGNSGNIGSSLLGDVDIMSPFLNIYSNLSLFEVLGLTHIFLGMFMLTNLQGVISILFGDYIIEKYNLETKYPRFSKVFKVRKKVSKYSLIISLALLLISILVLIGFNVYVFTIPSRVI